MIDLNKYIDHTLLRPTATPNEIEKLCLEAIKYDFFAVCVNGCYVSLAKELLKDTTIKIATVIGFPLGAMSSKAKAFEAENCILEGATEIDMVLNIGLLKAGEYKKVEEDIRIVKNAIGNNVLKVIFENCYLSDEEIQQACKISINAGADFIKTSTGFGTSGATVNDVMLMAKEAKNQIKIKASGGIRDFATAKQYIDLGVERIGTSSGIQIVSNTK